MRIKKKYWNYGLTILLVLIFYLVFINSIFNEKVKILEHHDFDQKKWFLVKGYYKDTLQYVLEDRNTLKLLRAEWVLTKSNDSFGTTGGYNIALYNENGRQMIMDIIYGSDWLSRNIWGELSNSEYGTLDYPNLKWVNLFPDKWLEARLIVGQFESKIFERKYLDSLRQKHKVFVLYHGSPASGNYMECLVTNLN